MRARHRSRS